MDSYSKVIIKLLKYYKEYLNNSEIKELENMEKTQNINPIFIRQMVSQVWDSYLTNPQNYTMSKPFKFLVLKDIDVMKINIEEIKNLSLNSERTLELVTEENAKEMFTDTCGIIVSINYNDNNSTLVLPIDFLEQKQIRSFFSFNILGIFLISLNIGDYNVWEEMAKEVSETLNIEMVNINKYLLTSKQKLPQEMLDSLANSLIAYYCLEYHPEIGINYNYREYLKEKYLDIIHKNYLLYVKSQKSLKTLVQEIFNLFDNDPEKGVKFVWQSLKKK